MKDTDKNERYNLGYNNSGLYNTGDYNRGSHNRGSHNRGSHNRGSHNRGDFNMGDFNEGDYNMGDFNSGNFNIGFFNSTSTTTNRFRAFNKPCDENKWENATKPRFIFEMKYSDLDNNKRTYKKVFRKVFKNITKKDLKLLRNLPNFDAKVFEEITEIDITKY